MKRVLLSLCFLAWLNAVATVAAQGHYPDFALVVQLPSYETSLTNLGDSPIKVDAYSILSASGSLSPSGWKTLSSAGPEIVAALGAGANQFFEVNPTVNSLIELNPISSATWQPGQSWSIGFPFNPDVVGFADAVFHISSPDGLLLTGGTVVFSPEQALASLLVVPEPSGPGDFNGDGAVDAADYVEWRKGLGAIYDQSDYGVWRAHFGTSVGPGSGSVDPLSLWSASTGPDPAPGGTGFRVPAAAVPEPHALFLVCCALTTLVAMGRRRLRSFASGKGENP
jgi:hypothetical protein